jgi:hypothetical protein
VSVKIANPGDLQSCARFFKQPGCGGEAIDYKILAVLFSGSAKLSKLTVSFFQLAILTAILAVAGCAESPQAQTRVTRYGVSFSRPPVKHLLVQNGLKRYSLVEYTTPYDIIYNWDRPNQWMANFRLEFLPNCFEADAQPIRKATAGVFPTKWISQPHFELTELEVENEDHFYKGSYRFRLGVRFTNIGNAGQALQIEGYLMLHPFDPKYLVVLSVLRDYDLQPVTQDPELHDMGMDWLASVTFSEPSPLERKVMREMKTWIVPPK